MQTGYIADLRRMPADEAFVKNYGGGGLKLGAKVMGSGVGGVLGGAGAGAVSAGAAEPAADALLPLYRTGKRYSEMTIEELRRVARVQLGGLYLP